MDSNLLIINSYFPNNPNTVIFDEGPLHEVIEYISNLVENINFTDLILCGDKFKFAKATHRICEMCKNVYK